MGVMRINVDYVQDPEDWPPEDEFYDFRFVAMRFVPRDTADLLQLNRLEFTSPLARRVSHETVVHDSVETGPFFYSGVAQKFGPGLFEWRPVGLVTANNGIFVVSADETTDVHVEVDFANLPAFPPPSP